MNNTTPEHQYERYYATKMNACTYLLDKSGTLSKDSTILTLWATLGYDPFTQRLKDMQAFVQNSHFIQFFDQHKAFYDSLTAQLSAHLPVLSFKTWLEAQFTTRFNYLKIIFSPLVYGAHSVQQFTDNDFSTLMIFIAAYNDRPDSSALYNKISSWRILFTELDHGYNNPVSTQYQQPINSAFKDVDQWGAGAHKGAYTSPLRVFDEYMTWGLFTLYCYDHLTPQELEWQMNHIKYFMEQYRQFPRFGAFNKQLLHLYQTKKVDQKIMDLYPAIIAWCKQQQ